MQLLVLQSTTPLLAIALSQGENSIISQKLLTRVYYRSTRCASIQTELDLTASQNIHGRTTKYIVFVSVRISTNVQSVPRKLLKIRASSLLCRQNYHEWIHVTIIDHRDENKRLMRHLAWRLQLGTPKDLPIIFHQIPIITPSLVPKWMNEAHADNTKLEHTDRGDDRHNFTH
jgi:hypothetical protein